MAAQIEETISILYTDTNETGEFKIKANLMERKVQLLDPETNQPMQRIDFGSCYYGCNLINLAMLYNSSPESVDYVILLEQNGLGAEVVRNALF